MSTPVSSTGSTASSSSTATQPIDYLGDIQSLTSSPFDPNTVINALISADEVPVTQLQSQITTIQNNATTYASIAKDVSALQVANFNLTLQSNTQAMTATSSNTSALSATASPLVQSGTYSVAVNNVATATTAQSTAAIGLSINPISGTTPLAQQYLAVTPTAGSFTVQVDNQTETVNVDPTKAPLDSSGGALYLLQQAVAQGLTAAGESSATTNVTLTNGQVGLQISGSTGTHTVTLGGDTSNFLSMMGLTGATGTTDSNGNLALTENVNVGPSVSGNTALSQQNLVLTPTAGTFTVHVDNQAVAVNVDPTKAPLSSGGALYQLQQAIAQGLSATGDSSAGVTVGLNNDQATINISGASTTHTISLSGDTSNILAMMGLTGANGTTNASGALAVSGNVTVGLAATTPLSSLNLNNPITEGTYSVVVDGKVQTLSVAANQTLLGQNGVLTQLQSTLQSAISAGGDSTTKVNVGISADKVAISLSGSSPAHTISFGGAGDTSNFLTIMGLTTAQLSSSSLSATSSAQVGVVQANQPLASADLATALTGTPNGDGTVSGTFSINGTSIDWDSSSDALTDVIARINSSTAGVIAQYDATNDQLVLSSKTTGQAAMSLADVTGNFLAAMNLAPGTTNAQQLGANASITVNGNTTVTSPSNSITTAVPGLTINATGKTAAGQPATITVGPDTTTITNNVQAFVTAVNKVIGDVNTSQQQNSDGTYGPLFGDLTLTSLNNNILDVILGQITTSGSYQSLQDVGITTGAVGATVLGENNPLVFDTTAFAAALAANPGQVASLFNGTQAANGFTGMSAQLDAFLQPEINPLNGPFAQEATTSLADVQQLQSQITLMQTQISNQRTMLTNQFTAMENTLNQLSSESSILGLSSSSSSSTSSSTTSSTTTS